MQITLESKPFAGVETEALVSYVFEESDPVQGRVAEIDHLGGGLLRRLAKSGELTGKMLEFTLLHAPAGLERGGVLFVGGGGRAPGGFAGPRGIGGAAPRAFESGAAACGGGGEARAVGFRDPAEIGWRGPALFEVALG